MRRLTPFRPELVIRCFPERERDPVQINRGQCFQWAYLAYQLFEGVRLWSFGTHAFVKYGQLYYDSERLNGERNWRDLPACNFGIGCGNRACQHCNRRAQPMDWSRFQEVWGGYQRPWHQYECVANEWLERNRDELDHQNTG